MKVVAISDVHGLWDKIKIPDCDLLISCGDYSAGRGSQDNHVQFHLWLDQQPADYIISVCGNHEMWEEANFDLAKNLAKEACPRALFLDEGLVEIMRSRIWCSAVTPWFHDWAWNRYPDEIRKHWNKIPDGLDILVTHGPAYGILDTVEGEDRHLGCNGLKQAIERVKPKRHFCGHIHSGHGYFESKYTEHYNVSICDEKYKAAYEPTIVYL